MKAGWTQPDTRDEVIDYVRYWSDRTELAATKLVQWLGIGSSKYYDWRRRYGKLNEHNAWVPRDFWLEDWEKGKKFRRRNFSVRGVVCFG